jgi:TolB-like protein
MENVKHAGLVFSFIAILVGCGSTPIQQENTYLSQYDDISISNQGQTLGNIDRVMYQSFNIDSAISEGSKYLASRITLNSKIAIVNVQSPANNVTNYIIDSLLMHLVNNDKFIVVERSELNALENELFYQLSGSVSDDTAVSLGKQLGTQFIISGSMLPLGDKYSLRLKVINVETAQIMGTKIFQINTDSTLTALLETQKDEIPAENDAKQSTVIHGDINITNNNTTTIHGDVYVNIPNGLNWVD